MSSNPPRPSLWRHLLHRIMSRVSAGSARPGAEGRAVLAAPAEHDTARHAAQQALLEQIARLEQQVQSLLSTGCQSEATMQESLAALEKQIRQAGREQFKANALAEAQREQLSSALELLRSANTRHTARLDELQQEVIAARSEARLEVVQALLPALDGIDEALRSGRALLDRLDGRPQPGFFERLRGRPPAASDAYHELHTTMEAWLTGLIFIRQRLLHVLEAEDVRPMESEGQPFDPHRHVVLHVVSSNAELAPGIVVSELRRGYTLGNRILRHAEVAVASANAGLQEGADLPENGQERYNA